MSNDIICTSLERQGILKTPRICGAMRTVDRGDFLPEGTPTSLKYIDQPVRVKGSHLSAPFIYARTLEALSPQLQHGAAFLNIGSGTGYLSYVVSLLIGEDGVNHGVEIQPFLVSRSKANVSAEDRRLGRHTDIQILQGNGLLVDTSRTLLYDAVYVGAGCVEESTREYLFSLLKVGGALVCPFEDELVHVVRQGSAMWEVKHLDSVCFSPIEMPPKKKKVDRAPIASTSDRREDVVRFAMKVWSPLADVTFPPGFRRSVRCCLLMAGHQESPTALIGKELWLEIIKFMHRDWFGGLVSTSAVRTESHDKSTKLMTAVGAVDNVRRLVLSFLRGPSDGNGKLSCSLS